MYIEQLKLLTKHVKQRNLSVVPMLVPRGTHVVASLVPLHGEVEYQCVPPDDVRLAFPRPVVRRLGERLGTAQHSRGDVVLDDVHYLVGHRHVFRRICGQTGFKSLFN